MIATFLHKTTAFVLVLLLFAHNINTLVIVGEFVANQAVIARDLCVQKDNQQGCNGKCQLTKQLKESTPDANTDVPVQEIRRMSLDAFCVFGLTDYEHENVKTIQHHNPVFRLTTSILTQYEDVETPPPNFI